jgi:hypothetical protein
LGVFNHYKALKGSADDDYEKDEDGANERWLGNDDDDEG